ncbi:hypothetical protein Tco_0444439 [Tanacetum coccineum]
MAYHDKYKKILDEVWKDNVELDGKIVKEEEEAVKRIKGEALKEKDDTGALADIGSDINTMPYRIYEQLGREDMKKVDRGITMINHTQAEAMGILTNVLCQVRVTTLISKFLILDIPIDRNSPIVTMRTYDDEAGSSRSKRSRQHETVEEVLLPQVHHEFLLWEGCNKDAKSREIDDMLRIRLREAGSDEEIFTLVAWIRAFNINEPIYVELCHELGLYQAVELEEEGFNVYFEGGLRSDEHFNAHDYWLSISREENLGLSRSHTSTIKSLILRIPKWVNVAWLIARVLIEDVVRSLSAPIYCRDLDTTTLRDLIDSEGKLIPEDPQPCVPGVGIPRPSRASMQDLYDRIVFEHMAGVYSVPLQEAYNPPSYAQPQYDQYYQQYPPPPQYPP